MPFVDANINQVIKTKRKTNPDFKKAWDNSRAEYHLIGQRISLHREEKITQEKAAELTRKREASDL